MYHCKSLRDDSFKNHADHVWRIVKYETPSLHSSINPMTPSKSKHKNTSKKFNKMNNYKLREGDMVKFGRVRFVIKKLVIDTEDIIDSAADDANDMSSFTKQTRADPNVNRDRMLTTHECENISQLHMNANQLPTDPETRMTMNYNRETLGFDHR